MESPFVSTAWLAERLGDPGLAIIDASWYLPAMERDAVAEYAAGHIPGAVFFSIDEIADKDSGLPHMLPSPEAFAEALGALGISETMTIIVYDGMGLFSAPRVWWSLVAMGARDVRLLEGGSVRWRAEGRPLEAGVPEPVPARFTPSPNPAMVADFDQVRAAIAGGGAQIIDARPEGRFRGEVEEPRPGLRLGHIPTSRNIPFTALVEDGTLRPPEALAELFAREGIDLEEPIVTSCGSGVTAAMLTLALETAGARRVRLYDGSWAEWGGRPDAPLETGPAKLP